MLVTELKERNDLPTEFLNILPEVCETCGSPLEITETLTGLKCSNPRCKDKMVKRIQTLCQDLNILYFGESTIRKFLNAYECNSPMGIFALQKGMLISPDTSLELSNKIIDQIQAKNSFTLWEYVKHSNLPHIRDNAKKIFHGYACIADAFKDIESGGVSFIKDKLGITSFDYLLATKTYNTLMLFKQDLLGYETDVNIIHTENLVELEVVCSDSVGEGYPKKKDFYADMNSRYSDIIKFDFKGSVSKSTDYLVWAGADGSPARVTSKVVTVQKWNESGKTNIPILTGKQLIERLNERFNIG